MDVRALPSRAVRKWQADGFVPLLSSTIHRARDTARRLRIRRTYRSTTLGDAVIEVDPTLITHFLIEGTHPATSYRERKGLVTKHELLKAYFPVVDYRQVVLPGDWDEHVKPHRFDRVYRGIRAHYLDGVEWEETEYGQHMLLLDELYDETYFDHRTSSCEELYRLIRFDGYERDPRPGGNVPVNVGRNGEVIFNNMDGHHRLALAKILGLETIPVVVVVRHERWEAIREEVAVATTIDDLSERARRHLDHPDVRPLHEFETADRESTRPADRSGPATGD
jgi:hypothetical protein